MRQIHDTTTKEEKNKPKEKLLLCHAVCHLKDTSRKGIQKICDEACARRFKDLLGIDRLMVAYHKPDSIRKVLIPSRLRECTAEIFNAKHHVENNDMRQPEKNTNVVEDRLEELNDDLSNKEIFNRKMHKLNQ